MAVVRILRVSSAILICAVPLLGQVDKPGGPHRFEKLGLTLDLSTLPGFEGEAVDHGQIIGRFKGQLGESDVEISVYAFQRRLFVFDDPNSLAGHISRTFSEGPFEFTKREYITGKYGYVPYAVLAAAQYKKRGSSEEGEQHYLFGIVEDYCYQVRAVATRSLGEGDRKRLVAFLRKGVQDDGKVHNWRWSDEEARARWEEHTPTKIHKQLEIRRTKHYIILYNAGGRLFAKKMEEFYKEIQKTFPFPEVEGRRLMPVFLFRINEQYYSYYSSVAGRSRATAGRSKGHAWRDYYATYYESPNDPVHIHEATHQIFSNRLGLSGGGSWFQEGVADYMSEKKNTIRASVRNQIKSGEFMRFKKLMVVPSLLGSIRGASVRGGSRANNAYLQSASIIRFLRHDKFGKDRFQAFIHAIGKVRRGDLKAIEAALQRIYQVDIDGLEARWKKYWR